MIFNKRNLLTGWLLFSTATAAMAQEAEAVPFIDSHFQGVVIILLLSTLLIFLFAVVSIFKALMNVLIDGLPEEKRAKYSMNILPQIDWQKLSRKLTDAVPVVNEKDIMLDHDYDGIRELDNHLPPWWKWMFYATIVWAIGFMSYYYVLGKGQNQYERYETVMAQAEVQKAEYRAKHASLIDESNVELQNDPAILRVGKDLFIANCATCHGDLGEGKIGPNLTDEFWIHGGTLKDIFKTIKYGVTGKMIPWEDMITPKDISDITNYVISLQGSNPPNAKEPQGEFVVVELDAAETVSDSTTLQ